jgi:ATP-dependent DNA helicase RecQ
MPKKTSGTRRAGTTRAAKPVKSVKPTAAAKPPAPRKARKAITPATPTGTSPGTRRRKVVDEMETSSSSPPRQRRPTVRIAEPRDGAAEPEQTPPAGPGAAAGAPAPRRRSRPTETKGARGRAAVPAAAASPPAAESVLPAPPPPPRDVADITAADILAAARRLGIEQLRPEQERVITTLLRGQDVLMILPTGFGKSACYQIPSLLLGQPVLVISPLLALLRDQHEKLQRFGVPTVRLDGTVRGRERTAAFGKIARGGGLLVMTTPESLENPDMRQALTTSGVALAALDEAHCISEWGHDFRPSYLRLGASLEALGASRRLALTATATPRVREAITHTLRMQEPAVVASSPHRSNLAFEVLPCTGDDRLRASVRLLQRLRRPGIVYCATKREVDLVYGVMQRFKIPSFRYHGGMTSGQRDAEQAGFMTPFRRTVMVATSAFGLGIDKRDIRYVMHFQGPASLEQYVQEAGRAGRDGNKANCILLHDEHDRGIHEALLAKSRIRPDQLYRLGSALAAWAGEGRSPSLQALALSAELSTRVTSALLACIEEAGLISRNGDSGTIEFVDGGRTIATDTRSLAGQFETLRTQDGRRLDTLAQYAAADRCRAAFLQEYFGEPGDEACGLCDICQQRDARPSSFFAPLAVPVDRTQRSGKRRGRRRGSRRQRPEPRGALGQVQPEPHGQRARHGRRRGRHRRHTQHGPPGQGAHPGRHQGHHAHQGQQAPAAQGSRPVESQRHHAHPHQQGQPGQDVHPGRPDGQQASQGPPPRRGRRRRGRSRGRGRRRDGQPTPPPAPS